LWVLVCSCLYEWRERIISLGNETIKVISASFIGILILCFAVLLTWSHIRFKRNQHKKVLLHFIKKHLCNIFLGSHCPWSSWIQWKSLESRYWWKMFGRIKTYKFKFNKVKLVFEFDKSELAEGLNGFLIKGYWQALRKIINKIWNAYFHVLIIIPFRTRCHHINVTLFYFKFDYNCK